MKFQTTKKSCYILDVSSLFFRSYYAISLNMKNEQGLPTNALYGVLKMIQKLIRSNKPDYLIACFDTKQASFRKEMYADYKINRSEMPEDLQKQVPYLKQMMLQLQIPSWEKPGFEADDLIASVVGYAKKKQLISYIVSGDKDFAQLVDKDTFLYDTMKNILYDPDAVQVKWGVQAGQMQDYLSLVGDSSDNIPGVSGVGPKRACALLKSYKNIEDIYKNIQNIEQTLQKKLLKHKDQACLSKQLVLLKKDLIWNQDLLKTTYKKVSTFSQKQQQSFKEFLQVLNFKSFLKQFFPTQTESPKPLKESWENIKNSTELVKNPARPVLKAKLVSLEDFKSQIPSYTQLWIGFYKDQIYLSYKNQVTLVSKNQASELGAFFDYKWIRYLGHDLKSFWKILKIKHPIAQWDSMIAGHVLSSQPAGSFKQLCYRYLQIPEHEDLELFQLVYQNIELQTCLINQLQIQELYLLFQEIELPLISVLYNMEIKGFLLNIKELQKQSQSLDQDLSILKQQIYKLVGQEFNISSPKQLAGILFDVLQLPPGRKTKTGLSTDSHELFKIKSQHAVLPLILEYRELFKLKSTYTDSLIKLVSSSTSRIYTEFKQGLTTTGRLSSVNPNLQNIPIRTQRGRWIRKAFIAPAQHELICADYSQIELRILAHITGDKNLIKAFEQDLDIHASTASEIFNIPLKEVSQDLRRKSKAVNFGIAYGQGAYGLAENLNISRFEAKQIIDSYFKKFSKIKDYIESTKELVAKTHFVKTLYGRKRFFNPEDLKHPKTKSRVERACINAPLQGTASDLIKKAMIRIHASLPIPIISQVHDELLFECPLSSLQQESQNIISIMESDNILNVPLKVNLLCGADWLSVK